MLEKLVWSYINLPFYEKLCQEPLQDNTIKLWAPTVSAFMASHDNILINCQWFKHAEGDASFAKIK